MVTHQIQDNCDSCCSDNVMTRQGKWDRTVSSLHQGTAQERCCAPVSSVGFKEKKSLLYSCYLYKKLSFALEQFKQHAKRGLDDPYMQVIRHKSAC